MLMRASEVNKYLTYELRQECDEYPPGTVVYGFEIESNMKPSVS